MLLINKKNKKNCYFLLFCSSLLSNVLLLVSEQQPLRLNPAEVCDVIAAVCSETSSTNLMTLSSKLSNNSRKPSMDVAVSVLVKLVIDMYVPIHWLAGIVQYVLDVWPMCMYMCVLCLDNWWIDPVSCCILMKFGWPSSFFCIFWRVTLCEVYF